MSETQVDTAPGTDVVRVPGAVQLVASGGFFQESLAYTFQIRLSRAPKPGEFVTLRASTHYFENSLPLSERFALP
jgi:hypothetical protein